MLIFRHKDKNSPQLVRVTKVANYKYKPVDFNSLALFCLFKRGVPKKPYLFRIINFSKVNRQNYQKNAYSEIELD